MNTYGGYMNTTSNRDNTRHPDTEVANRVMNAIIVKGSNLTKLAEAAGISYSTLRRSIHQERPDRRSFTIDELIAIARALNTPASALLPEDLTAEAAA